MTPSMIENMTWHEFDHWLNLQSEIKPEFIQAVRNRVKRLEDDLAESCDFNQEEYEDMERERDDALNENDDLVMENSRLERRIEELEELIEEIREKLPMVNG